jgi:diguanylate cyclase (GGDEF)-like protein/PAS domain S-box-containing protein
VYIASALIFSLPLLIDAFLALLRKKENDFNESERLFINTLENARVGIALLSKDGHWAQANTAFCKMLGYSKDEIEKLTIQDIIYPEDLSNTNIILKKLTSSELKYCDIENRCLSKAGKIVWVHLSAATIFGNDQRPQYFILHVENITKEKMLQKEMRYTATHDLLTGLLNRKQFKKALNEAVDDLKSKGIPYILCYLDLDFFKIINYVSGHIAGDQVLREIAIILRNRLRKVDILARLGGDEFGMLLSNTSLKDGKIICQELIELFNSKRFVWNNNTYHVDMSIGMVMLSDSKRSPSQLLSDADLACYAAKSEGRNRIFVYQNDQPESQEYSHKIVLANSIRGQSNFFSVNSILLHV